MSKFGDILTKDYLYSEYITNTKSMPIIAKEVGCTWYTVRRMLKKHNIVIRNLVEAQAVVASMGNVDRLKYKELTKDYLYENYIINGKSLKDISIMVGCAITTVNHRMIHYGMVRRTSGQARLGKPHNYKAKYDDILTKEYLYTEYIVNKKSPLDIANEIGCSRDTIPYRLRKYKINVRGYKECVPYRKPKPGGGKGKFNSNYGNYKINATTPIMGSIRNLYESREWRTAIFKRDDFTCRECLCNKGGRLNAHHIKHFAVILSEFLKEYYQFSPVEDKETLLRLAINYKPFWDLENGITLCKECHKKRHTKKETV